jgi:multiple sugar transport system ATP-binding protein
MAEMGQPAESRSPALPSGTGVVGVTVRRGGTLALRDLTVLADEGELLVVLGPSGSGKTTLLRCLAGLEHPDSGQVLIRSRPVRDLPPSERGAAMVFEETELIPFLDVAANMGWGLRVRHVPKDQTEERVVDRARRLGLGGVLRSKAQELSVGERGAVGVGRALVATPEVFLLDEPLAHLDPGQRTQVRRQIVDVVRSTGVATLYVTHDQTEAMAIADRIALLHEGRLVQLGRPMDLYHRPASVLVAAFLGTPAMGFLPARLVSSQGFAAFEVGGHTLPLWSPVLEPLANHLGDEVVLGLRSPDVLDADAQPDGLDHVVLPATVTGLEYTGRQTVVSADVQGSSLAAIDESVLAAMPLGTTLRAHFHPRTTVRAGDAVRLAVDVSRAHVFDAATGQALWHPDVPD